MLAGPGEPTSILYAALAEEFPIDAVIMERPVERTKLLRNRLRRLGPVTVAGQLAFQSTIAPVLRWSARARSVAIHKQFGLRTEPIPSHLVRRVESANDDQSIGFLREFQPKVVVVSGTRILSKRVLAAVDSPFLNMHAGITPAFRGVHGGYWSLAEGRPERCGVTVHLVDSGVDTGTVLGQRLIHPTREDNFATYPLLQLAAGIPLMKDAVRAALNDVPLSPTSPPDTNSRQWYHPTAWGYLARRLARDVR